MCPFLCFFICWSTFVINTGPGGPYFVDFLEVPKMIQRILQYVRMSKLAILEKNPPPPPNKYINKPSKTKTLPKMFAVFGALLDPVLGPKREVREWNMAAFDLMAVRGGSRETN